jgi:hypothetical protein
MRPGQNCQCQHFVSEAEAIVSLSTTCAHWWMGWPYKESRGTRAGQDRLPRHRSTDQQINRSSGFPLVTRWTKVGAIPHFYSHSLLPPSPYEVIPSPQSLAATDTDAPISRTIALSKRGAKRRSISILISDYWPPPG